MINYNNLSISVQSDDAVGIQDVEWVPNSEFVDFDIETGGFF